MEASPSDRRLAALIDSGLALASERDLDTLLQRIADLALEVIGAKYGAVGVLGEEGGLAKFVHSGIDAKTVEQIGALPTGKGVLGALIEEGKPLRLKDISEHPSSYGFPEHHPVMRTFLGVPIVVRGRAFGRLYLTEKQGAQGFSKDDERLGLVFAAQAGVAVENARLTEALQDLAVLEERERISKELHDGVIQSIYSAGLSLQGSIGLLKHNPDLAKTRIDQVIGELDNVVRDVRGYIFELRPKIIEEGGFREAVGELARDLEINTLAHAAVEIEEGACDALDAAAQAQIVQVVREIFSNIARHANASEVLIQFRKTSANEAGLVVEDDGVGFDPGSVSMGDGLSNIRDRAARLGGTLTITARLPKGTRHELRIPVGPKENNDE